MKLNEGFVLRDVCGEKAIVAEGLNAIDFGKLISLNETAAWLWEKAAELGEFSIEQLADELCNEYNVDKERAITDVTALINTWTEQGLVG